MPSSVQDLESHPVRVALAFESYQADRLRMASYDLGQSTHIVSTRRGLFGVCRTGFVQLTFGYYFGITLRGQDIFAFESCDLPHGPTRQGRIVRLRLEGQRIVDTGVMLKGLDNGCHQIDFFGAQLHIVDTYNQQILRCAEDFSSHETLSPLPVCPTGKWPKEHPAYRHVNSLLQVGDRNLLLLHTGRGPDGRSELDVYDLDWNPIRSITLNGRWCHGLALEDDGSLLTCGSAAGEIIGTGGLCHKVSPLMTRGLAVGADGIVVGGSRYGSREERIRSSGTVTFLNHAYEPEVVVELPGAPVEIRRLDGADRGLSLWLKQQGLHPQLRLENAS